MLLLINSRLRQTLSREQHSLSALDKEEKSEEHIGMTSHWILIITCLSISGMTVSGLFGNRNVKSSTGNTKNAPSVQTDEWNGDNDDDADDEEVTGTEDCLIKKRYALECSPKEANDKNVPNMISEDSVDSEGKITSINYL